MCRRIAKYGLMFTLLMMASFVIGGLLSMAGYIALWWEFPRSWEPLTGLNSAPQDLLALQAPGGTFLLRTESGQLFTCREGHCDPQSMDWSPEAVTCDETTRPMVVSLFPVILSRDIQVALGCESGYQDMGSTIYVVYDRQGAAYWSGGLTMIPTDAGVVIVGILGGLVSVVLALVAVGIAGVILALRKRSAEMQYPEAG